MRVWSKEEPPRCCHKGGVFLVPAKKGSTETLPTVTAGALGQRYIFPERTSCKFSFTSAWGLSPGLNYEQVNGSFRARKCRFWANFATFATAVKSGSEGGRVKIL